MKVNVDKFKSSDAVVIYSDLSIYLCKIHKIEEGRIYTQKYLRIDKRNKLKTEFHSTPNNPDRLYFLIHDFEITSMTYMPVNYLKKYMRLIKNNI